MTTDADLKHYYVMFEDADKQAQHIDYARFRHFGAKCDGEAEDFCFQFAPDWATGFVLYEKDGPSGHARNRIGVYDITCPGCGATKHKGNCLPRCSECGAIATGLTPDETDMSVGLFGPGPMCVACDKKEQRACDADPTQPGALLINLRNALRYGKD